MQAIDYSDVLHAGTHTFEKSPVMPAGSIGDAQVGATNPITSTKLKHRHNKMLAQVHGSAAVAERRPVHVARSAGSLVQIEAGVVVAAVGNATVTIDVYKNGLSILSSTIVLDNTNGAYAEEQGAIASAAYVLGDVFEVVVTINAGTGTLPQGLYVSVVFDEGSG